MGKIFFYQDRINYRSCNSLFLVLCVFMNDRTGSVNWDVTFDAEDICINHLSNHLEITVYMFGLSRIFKYLAFFFVLKY